MTVRSSSDYDIARKPSQLAHTLFAPALGIAVALWFSPWVYSSAAPASAPRPVAAPSSLAASAPNSWSALLRTTEPATTARVQILRNGRVIDDVPLVRGGDLSYVDNLLWPATSYRYEIRAVDQGGKPVRDESFELSTPPQLGSFPLLYSANSFWNTPIADDATVDPNSTAIVFRSLAHYASSSSIATSDDWGRPIAYANALTTRYSVRCTRFDCDTSVTFRIPRYARPSNGSDHHLVASVTNRPPLDQRLVKRRAVRHRRYRLGGQLRPLGPLSWSGCGRVCRLRWDRPPGRNCPGAH